MGDESARADEQAGWAPQWVWDPSSRCYRWWDGERYTITARRAGDDWSFEPARTDAPRERWFGIATATALAGLLVAGVALLEWADPGPGEDPDPGLLTTVFTAGVVLFVLGAVAAAVLLVRSLRSRSTRRP